MLSMIEFQTWLYVDLTLPDVSTGHGSWAAFSEIEVNRFLIKIIDVPCHGAYSSTGAKISIFNLIIGLLMSRASCLVIAAEIFWWRSASEQEWFWTSFTMANIKASCIGGLAVTPACPIANEVGPLKHRTILLNITKKYTFISQNF